MHEWDICWRGCPWLLKKVGQEPRPCKSYPYTTFPSVHGLSQKEEPRFCMHGYNPQRLTTKTEKKRWLAVIRWRVTSSSALQSMNAHCCRLSPEGRWVGFLSDDGWCIRFKGTCCQRWGRQIGEICVRKGFTGLSKQTEEHNLNKSLGNPGMDHYVIPRTFWRLTGVASPG